MAKAPSDKKKDEEETPEELIKNASAAERKAAMEAMLEEEGVIPFMRPAPKRDREPLEAPPEERKAAVENLMKRELGSTLAKAPWKRSREPDGEKQEAAKASAESPNSTPATGETESKAEAPANSEPQPLIGRSPTRIVLVDTNALMMQFQFHIDIERELRRILDFKYEIVVPDVVRGELETLAKEARGKDAGEARMALELAKTFKNMEAPSQGDTGILRLAEKTDAIVVTNDKILRARLRAKNIPNVYMRSSAFLTVEGHISGL